MRGPARYKWQHGILAEDIHDKRMVITLRELPDEILKTDIGQELKEISQKIIWVIVKNFDFIFKA